jgi:hypothetical protein
MKGNKTTYKETVANTLKRDLAFFFLISNVNFIKSAEGCNPKKIYTK